jgi:hypothetical protein
MERNGLSLNSGFSAIPCRNQRMSSLLCPFLFNLYQNAVSDCQYLKIKTLQVIGSIDIASLAQW